MQLVLLEEAQQQFEEEDAWWRENRDAKDLFIDEFSAVLGRISSMPEVGQRYRRTRGKLIQRMLMKKTRCHVYYFHDQERGMIEIHQCGAAARNAARSCSLLLFPPRSAGFPHVRAARGPAPRIAVASLRGMKAPREHTFGGSKPSAARRLGASN